MKKLVLFASILFASCSTYIKGTYISDDKELSFTFKKDSLYIDMASSGCGLTAYNFVAKEKFNDSITLYIAEETYIDFDRETNGKALIILTKVDSIKYKLECIGYDFTELYYSEKMLIKR